MQITNIIWLATALLAVAMLLSMLRRRQNQLLKLLQAHVQEQIEWSRKKARAGRLARKAAAQQIASEANAPSPPNPVSPLGDFDAAAVQAASSALAELVDQPTQP